MKYTSELARPIAEKYDLREDDVVWALESTIDHLQGHAKFMGQAKRRDALQEQAVKLLTEWLERGEEWAVDESDLRAIADFVRSHAAGCVWAVLIAKSRIAWAATPHMMMASLDPED
jgi:hypothetical protein